MREIKFRGKELIIHEDGSRHSGLWFHGFYREYTEGDSDKGFTKHHVIYVNHGSFPIEVVPETVGQLIESDSKHNEIYEGDICNPNEYIEGIKNDALGVAQFDSMENKYVFRSVINNRVCNWFFFNVLVVGNIYDNPKLLKGE